MTKAIDIVKNKPTTNLEAWERWMNRMQSELLTLPYYHKKIIEVKDEPEESMEDLQYADRLLSRQDYLDSVDEDRYQQD